MFRVSGQCFSNTSPLDWPAGHVMSQVSSDSTHVSIGAHHNHLQLPGHKHWQVDWEERWRWYLCDLCHAVPREENFKSCCNWLVGEEMFTVVPSRKVQRNWTLLWLQHHLLPWTRSGLRHLTCADSAKENWKLLLPLSRDESRLLLREYSLSLHFWAGEECWVVICETISWF